MRCGRSRWRRSARGRRAGAGSSRAPSGSHARSSAAATDGLSCRRGAASLYVSLSSQRLGVHGVDLVRLGWRRKHHVQKVGGEGEGVGRVDDGLADGCLVCDGRDGGHLCDHPDGREPPLRSVVDVDRIWVEGRERAHHRDHDRHRVSVRLEAAEEGEQLLVYHPVLVHLCLEAAELRRRWQLALDEEEGDLEEGARGGELLDRVAAVHQQALRAVDEGDGALARRGGREAGVVREEARLCVERSHVDHRVAEPRVRVQDRKLDGVVA
mmetsp:Transcript_49137/g.159237  ORF Transcript_49137/g.159237 Transcript_49137/m.159237 type:complete len:268 (-) Transcript_49137:176-979(-)